MRSFLHMHTDTQKQPCSFPGKMTYDHILCVTEGLLWERQESLTQAVISLAEIAALLSSTKMSWTQQEKVKECYI